MKIDSLVPYRSFLPQLSLCTSARPDLPSSTRPELLAASTLTPRLCSLMLPSTITPGTELAPELILTGIQRLGATITSWCLLGGIERKGCSQIGVLARVSWPCFPVGCFNRHRCFLSSTRARLPCFIGLSPPSLRETNCFFVREFYSEVLVRCRL